MTTRNRANNLSTLRTTTAWSPALSATGVFGSDLLQWGAISAANSATNMGGSINIAGATGGIKLLATQVNTVTINHTVAATLTLGALGVDTSLSTSGILFGANADVTMNDATTAITVNGGIQFDGTVSGSSAVTVSGVSGGSVVFNQASFPFTGSITVTASGAIDFNSGTGSTASLTVNGSVRLLGSATIATLISGSGTVNRTSSAASTTVTLNNISASSTNTFSVGGGGFANANQTFILTSLPSGASYRTFAGVSTETVTLRYTGAGNASTGAFTSASSAGSSIFDRATTGNVSFTTLTHTSASNASLLVSSSFAGTTTFGGSVSESAAGIFSLFVWDNVVLSGANTFRGSVALTSTNKTLYANSILALGADQSTGTVNSTNTISIGAALNYSTRAFTISGSGVSSGGALVHNFAGTAKIGPIALGAATYFRGTVSGTSTLSSSITNGGFALTAGAASGNTLTLTGGISGLGGLVVGNSSSDTGTVTLTTANTYQGNTTASFGTLNANNALALGAASSTAGISVTSGATLSLGAVVNYSSPGRTTSISGTGVSGVDAGCLVLADAGPLNLGAINATNNTYIRGTTTTQLTSAISWSGTGGLRLGAATGTTATFSGAISVSSGTLVALLFGRSNNPDLGTVVLATSNTFAAPAQIDYGTLRISADANLGNFPGAATAAYLIVGGNTTLATTATFTLNPNRGIALGPSSGSGTGTIDVASATTLTYSGVVANNSAGTGKLTRSGTGTLKLTGTNTYSGGSDLGAGTVQAGAVQALGSSGTVTLTTSGATLQTLTAGFSEQNGKLTVAALTNSAGGTIKIGG